MSDTNHGHGAPIPVEGDGVSYSGIVWFIVILTGTTLFCQVLVWGFFEFMDYRVSRSDAPRSTLAVPSGTLPPAPNLLVDEPATLRTYRATEAEILTTYGWLNKDFGTIHIPIAIAKDKLMEKGLPTRQAPDAAKTQEAAPAKAEREGHGKH